MRSAQKLHNDMLNILLDIGASKYKFCYPFSCFLAKIVGFCWQNVMLSRELDQLLCFIINCIDFSLFNLLIQFISIIIFISFAFTDILWYNFWMKLMLYCYHSWFIHGIMENRFSWKVDCTVMPCCLALNKIIIISTLI